MEKGDGHDGDDNKDDNDANISIDATYEYRGSVQHPVKM